MPGLFSRIGEFLTGKSDKFHKLPTLSQGQQGSLDQILQQLQGMGQSGGAYGLSQDYLKGILSGDQGAYNQFASPYLQNFEQQIIPRLSERFAGLGGGLGGGTLGSSGFGQAVGGAGAQLQAQLAQLYAGLRQNAAGQAMGQYNQLANQGLGTRSFENLYQPGTQGFLGSAASGIGQGLGQGFGMGAGYKMFGSTPAQKDPGQGIGPQGYNGSAGYYDPYGGY